MQIRHLVSFLIIKNHLIDNSNTSVNLFTGENEIKIALLIKI